MLLLLQAIPSTPAELVTGSSISTKVVLGILIVLSLISWGIMMGKWFQFRRVTGISRKVDQHFVRVRTMDEAAGFVRRTGGPHASLMDRALRFLEETKPALAGNTERTARFSASQVESLR